MTPPYTMREMARKLKLTTAGLRRAIWRGDLGYAGLRYEHKPQETSGRDIVFPRGSADYWLKMRRAGYVYRGIRMGTKEEE